MNTSLSAAAEEEEEEEDEDVMIDGLFGEDDFQQEGLTELEERIEKRTKAAQERYLAPKIQALTRGHLQRKKK